MCYDCETVSRIDVLGDDTGLYCFLSSSNDHRKANKISVLHHNSLSLVHHSDYKDIRNSKISPWTQDETLSTLLLVHLPNFHCERPRKKKEEKKESRRHGYLSLHHSIHPQLSFTKHQACSRLLTYITTATKDN